MNADKIETSGGNVNCFISEDTNNTLQNTQVFPDANRKQNLVFNINNYSHLSINIFKQPVITHYTSVLKDEVIV